MYHFIGIAGAGMSSLAQIMYKLGHKVKGSDISTDFFTLDGLSKEIEVSIFSEENITEDLIIVRGNSFDDSNVEVAKAKELNLKIYTYQEMVAKLTRTFETISVSGCHGKTTTSSMLAHVLNNITGTNYLIGDGSGYASKDNKYFVLEACEYKRHFLEYDQKYAIITNIDLDHVDYFKDIDDVIDAYQSFYNNTKEKVIMYGDDPYTRRLNLDDKAIYYGLKDNNDVVAKNIKYEEKGTTFDVYIKGEFYDTFFTSFSGEHMVLNSLAIITVCYLENLDKKLIKKYHSSFEGAKRRFDVKLFNDNIIIDDYAHHPTEINYTIDAVRQKYQNKTLVSIFQPHTFSRTEKFKEEFISVLNKSDYVYILDIHPAREKSEDFPNVNSKELISKINNASSIKIDDASPLLKHDNSVLLFLSPNSLKNLISDYKEKS